jgi:hypothetical protein
LRNFDACAISSWRRALERQAPLTKLRAQRHAATRHSEEIVRAAVIHDAFTRQHFDL